MCGVQFLVLPILVPLHALLFDSAPDHVLLRRVGRWTIVSDYSESSPKTPFDSRRVKALFVAYKHSLCITMGNAI